MTMSWDSQVTGFPYLGEPPTPTATPTSATAPDFNAVFRTPKTYHATFDNRGNWTAGEVVDTASFKTPQRVSRRASLQRPLTATSQQSSFSDKDILGPELAGHVHHVSPNPNLALPPVDSSQQLGSSPVPSPTGPGISDNSGNPYTPSKPDTPFLNLQRSQSARSMQTPPPTRAMGSKRKAKHPDVPELSRSYSAGQKKITTPNTANRSRNNGMPLDALGESPQTFSSFQFSPDLFGFPMSGPATAPVLQQPDLFWDPNSSMSGMAMDFGGNSFFEQGLVRDDAMFTLGDMGKQATATQNPVNDMNSLWGGLALPRQANFGQMTHSVSSDSFHPFPVPASAQRKQLAGHPVSEASVNPNLLFTSSSPPPAIMSNTSMVPGGMSQENRQPYQHQKEQSQIEEMERQRLQQQLGGQSHPQSKLMMKKAARPGLTRSATDSALGGNRFNSRRNVPIPLGSNQGNANQGNANQGNMAAHHAGPSPTKSTATSGSTLASPSPRTRTKVKFTIDTNGRARTETEVVMDESESSTDLDIRKGLDGSWLGESDSSADEDLNYTISRNSSFTFPQQTSQPNNVGRPDSSASKRNTRPSTGSSSDSSRQPSVHSFSGLPVHPRQLQVNPNRVSGGLDSSDDPESEAETVVETDDTDGGAQSALRRVVAARAQKNKVPRMPYSSSNYFSPNVRRGASSRMPPASTPSYNYNSSYLNTISPTTITDPESATPSTDRDSSSSGDTRCVCGTDYNASGLMVQCESCTKWLHVKCVGLNRNRLPAVYVCVFCTGQTPLARGGRVRDPMRGSIAMPSSPLAHKSGRF